jgi:ATP-dependent protease ClpP protease subunit
MTPEKPMYINFLDPITPQIANKFIKFTVDHINQYQPTALHYFMSSSGGDVDSGFAMHNFLLSLQNKLSVSMHNIGTVDSIANVIFMAGQKRYAAPNASFLYHGIVANYNGAMGSNAIRENLSRLIGMETRMAETISKKSKLTIAELQELFQQGEGKSVEFALEKEIIHEIISPSIPKGALHFAMSFQ